MSAAAKEIPEITERQKQVIRAIARGLSVAEIAESLNITPRTVKGHTDALRWKLGVPKRRQIPLAYMAITGDNPYPGSR